MAFEPGSIASQYTTQPRQTGSFVPGSVARQYQTTSTRPSAFTPGSIASLYSTNKASDLKSTDGLYNLAVENGLQGEADRLLAAQQGEETKNYFSGGVISDIFDVINTLQYRS